MQKRHLDFFFEEWDSDEQDRLFECEPSEFQQENAPEWIKGLRDAAELVGYTTRLISDPGGWGWGVLMECQPDTWKLIVLENHPKYDYEAGMAFVKVQHMYDKHGMEMLPCPKCQGKGCPVCDGLGEGMAASWEPCGSDCPLHRDRCDA